jgi:phage-related protein
MPQTKVVFYKEEDGTVPTQEWLDNLPRQAREKCGNKMKRLKALGHELRRPEADYLRDGIYELRIRLGTVNYRLLYFFYKDITTVVSHGLTKERLLPPREIERAIERRRKFHINPEPHTQEIEECVQ